MASNSFGNIFKFTSFGESHGKAIGCIVDGVPPLIPISEEDIQVSAKQASVRQRKELKLQNKFIDNLKSKGYKTSSSRVDIVAKKNNEIHFIEAKILTSQTKAAQALGQLLFYEYKVSQEDKPTSLFLLFDKKPEKETIDFVKQYKVTIIYESGDSFKQIDWDS